MGVELVTKGLDAIINLRYHTLCLSTFESTVGIGQSRDLICDHNTRIQNTCKGRGSFGNTKWKQSKKVFR